MFIIQYILICLSFVITSEDNNIEQNFSNYKRKNSELQYFENNTIKKKRFSTFKSPLQSQINSTSAYENISLPYSTESHNLNHNNHQLHSTNQQNDFLNMDEAKKNNLKSGNSQKKCTWKLEELSDQIHYDTMPQLICKESNLTDPTTSDHYQVLENTMEISEGDVISNQKKNFINHLYGNSFSKFVDDYLSFPMKVNSSIDVHPVKSIQSIYSTTTSANEINAREKNQDVQIEQSNIKITEQSSQIQSKKSPSLRTRNRQIFQNIQTLILKKNLNFITEISSFFESRIIFSPERDMTIDFLNLKIFLKNQINMANSKLIKDTLKTKKALRSRNIKNVTKLIHFCPFCKAEKLDEKDLDKIIEKKIIANFPVILLTVELTMKIQTLFDCIAESFKKPFTLENLFSCQFFKQQRMILENILNYFDSNKISFGKHNRRKYLHIEYHKLFLKNVDMKLYFLPELQSIIYILLRTSLDHNMSRKNRNFFLLFYSFYSMNMFFEWIHDFYQKNKVTEISSADSLSKFVTQTISFILRISFIIPLCSLISVHENAQMRYYLFCLNVYHNELCTFLYKDDHKSAIETNSKILLPVIILIEKHLSRNLFMNLLEFKMPYLIQINQSCLLDFIKFLGIMKKGHIIALKDQSEKLENFLQSHLSN